MVTKENMNIIWERLGGSQSSPTFGAVYARATNRHSEVQPPSGVQSVHASSEVICTFDAISELRSAWYRWEEGF